MLGAGSEVRTAGTGRGPGGDSEGRRGRRRVGPGAAARPACARHRGRVSLRARVAAGRRRLSARHCPHGQRVALPGGFALRCSPQPRHPHGATERRCAPVTAPGASARPPGSCTEPGARGPVLRAPQRSPALPGAPRLSQCTPNPPQLAAAAPGPWGCPLWSSAIRIWTARISGSDCSVTRSSWREPTSSSKSC